MSFSIRCTRLIHKLRVLSKNYQSSRSLYTKKYPHLYYGQVCLQHHIRCYSDITDKEGGDEKVTLSKAAKEVQLSAESSSSSSSDSDSDSSSSSDEEPDVDPKLKDAAKAAAESLPGDKNVTHLDLLQKLQAYASVTEAQRQGLPPPSKKSDLSKLVSGMRVEQKETQRPVGPRGAPGDRFGKQGRRARPSYQDEDYDDTDTRGMRGLRRDRPGREGGFNQQRRPMRGQSEADVKLFDGPSLGIFTKTKDKETRLTTGQSLFDKLDEEQISKQIALPPNNPFEEMILLTKQGKVWKFPIDNEQGMEIEEDIGFHEHVFLDHFLEDFPERGPVRHFMELVVTGLSKNPFLTLQQKAEHVEWFKDYFKDKYKIIDALIVDSAAKTETKPET